MRLNRLLIHNFRNYGKEELLWHPKVNIIRGFNAQGKSNLLESIAYLSLASSFRGATDTELIHFERDFFHIQGDILHEGRVPEEIRLSVGFSRNKRKSWKVNEQSRRRLGEILGHFHSVIFSPDDLYLVKSGPLARRRYLNRQMIQLYPDFYSLLLKYNQVLKQRNFLLKKGYYGCSKEEVRPWSHQLAAYAAPIYRRRLEILNELSKIAADFHQQLCREEVLTVEYRGFLPAEEISALNDQELAQAFESSLEENWEREKARGVTSIGPHRDDLEICINGISARRFGSQGQQRSAALSLKLAELDLAHQIKGEYPVLLLDDVMSELDIQRRSQLLALTSSKAQLFITATDLNFQMNTGKIILVDDGKIIEET